MNKEKASGHKQTPYIYLSVSFCLFLGFSSVVSNSLQAYKMLYLLSVCCSPGWNFNSFFGLLNLINWARKGCFNTGKLFHWIADALTELQYVTYSGVVCKGCVLQSLAWMRDREERLRGQRCCRALNDRCADVHLRRSLGEQKAEGVWGGGVGLGWGVMLIKAAHLQPIKEPLSLINWNLLKHAALDAQNKQTVLHAHS